MSTPPQIGNDCHPRKQARDFASRASAILQIHKLTILHYNFTIFKLRSTTEQMPALVFFIKKDAWVIYRNDPGRLMQGTLGFLEHLGVPPEHSSTSTVQVGLVPSVVQPWRGKQSV
jgi:hypothetical protein